MIEVIPYSRKHNNAIIAYSPLQRGLLTVKIKPGQLVIRCTIEQPGITIVLVGARNRKQAIENAKANNVRLSSDEMAFINGELEKLHLIR